MRQPGFESPTGTTRYDDDHDLFCKYVKRGLGKSGCFDYQSGKKSGNSQGILIYVWSMNPVLANFGFVSSECGSKRFLPNQNNCHFYSPV